MENQKNNKGVIALLIVIIVILSALCILFATGTISFNSNKETDNVINENVNDNYQSDNNKNVDVTKKFKLENNGVDENDLNEAFDILGLYEYYNSNLYTSFDEDKECLNNYISQNDFRKNNKEIFAWYALTHDMGTNTGQTEIIRDVDGDGKADIAACGGAADCGSIKISDANKIITLYKLTGMDEYLDEMPEPYKNTEYLINYYTLTGMHPIMCNIKINHNVEAKYNENNNLVIIDTQNVTEYGFFEESEQIKSQKDKIVTYNFKKDSNNIYYLDNVNVK